MQHGSSADSVYILVCRTRVSRSAPADGRSPRHATVEEVRPHAPTAPLARRAAVGAAAHARRVVRARFRAGCARAVPDRGRHARRSCRRRWPGDGGRRGGRHRGVVRRGVHRRRDRARWREGRRVDLVRAERGLAPRSVPGAPAAMPLGRRPARSADRILPTGAAPGGAGVHRWAPYRRRGLRPHRDRRSVRRGARRAPRPHGGSRSGLPRRLSSVGADPDRGCSGGGDARSRAAHPDATPPFERPGAPRCESWSVGFAELAREHMLPPVARIGAIAWFARVALREERAA